MISEGSKPGPAEIACDYVAERVRRAAGNRWLQGALVPPHACSAAPISVRLFAEHRLHRVPSAAARALVAWARGERRVDLLFHVPTPREVLALQAKGRRCVSLLDDQTPTAPHADGLAFALHDLCHLEKLSDPEHYAAQVGFFASVHAAMEDPRWALLEATLDPVWTADRDHVIADMNGSAVFLILALKSKLRMAVHRRFAQTRGEPSATEGSLSIDLRRERTDALDSLLELLNLRGSLGDAARALSERGGAPAAEVQLHNHFVAHGAARL